eukprot:m.69232 g.69232  ORF g.69232 m.69232 type:complete len:62 (-) comp9957_c0_seq1:14-199(-)
MSVFQSHKHKQARADFYCTKFLGSSSDFLLIVQLGLPSAMQEGTFSSPNVQTTFSYIPSTT